MSNGCEVTASAACDRNGIQHQLVRAAVAPAFEVFCEAIRVNLLTPQTVCCRQWRQKASAAGAPRGICRVAWHRGGARGGVATATSPRSPEMHPVFHTFHAAGWCVCVHGEFVDATDLLFGGMQPRSVSTAGALQRGMNPRSKLPQNRIATWCVLLPVCEQGSDAGVADVPPANDTSDAPHMMLA